MTIIQRQRKLSQNKAALVEAHRNGDGEASRRLSQEREELKRGYCRVCGVATLGTSCMMHRREIHGDPRRPAITGLRLKNMIRLIMDGMRHSDVAAIIGASKGTVRETWERYRENNAAKIISE